MWEKKCHKTPMTGNGNHTTCKNGGDWGWFIIVLPSWGTIDSRKELQGVIHTENCVSDSDRELYSMNIYEHDEFGSFIQDQDKDFNEGKGATSIMT